MKASNRIIYASSGACISGTGFGGDVRDLNFFDEENWRKRVQLSI